jgi:hypothetical protein
MHNPQGSIWTRAPLLATDVFSASNPPSSKKERTTPHNEKVV